jgi:hypothetical protein
MGQVQDLFIAHSFAQLIYTTWLNFAALLFFILVNQFTDLNFEQACCFYVDVGIFTSLF